MLYLKDVTRNGIPYERHSISLYDLRRDPDCRTDVALESPEAVRALRRHLVDWLSTSPGRALADEHQASEEQVALLRSLGYVGAPADPAGAEWIDLDCSCDRCAAFR